MKRLNQTVLPKLALGLFTMLLGASVARADFIDYELFDKHYHHAVSSFTDGGAKYTKSGGIESFYHLNTTCNRVEHDTDTHYQTGVHTFTGQLKLIQVAGKICIQIFNAKASSFMAISGYSKDGGTLEKQGGDVVLATGVLNKWVKIKIVHDLNANTVTIYINDVKKYTAGGGKGGSFNLKYGNYGSGAPTETQWKDAKWTTS